MRLYEKYFADIDALNDDKIAELRNFREETTSLIKYYYLDIPLDTCAQLKVFDQEYSDKLLGSDWHKYLFDGYKKFRENSTSRNKSKECLKAEFSNQVLSAFYDAMDYIFRDGFGTNSVETKHFIDGLSELLFGKGE